MTHSIGELTQAIEKWRAKQVNSYWLRVDYIGSALNRLGNHTLTYADGTLWHLWHDDWREIPTGADFWLFSVPGAFAWSRDTISEAASVGAPDSVQIRFNESYGYLEFLRVKMPERDASNFTFEVKDFGEGTHPEFKK